MFIKDGIAYAAAPMKEIRVLSVKPLDDKMMILTFASGEKRLYDATPLLDYPAFQPLKDDSVFKNAKVEHMRLLIEGAVVLYENDVMPLYSMAMEQERYQEAAGLDTLGAALTTLQSDIRELQNAYTAYQAGKDAPC